ncbi:MAG: CoA transferase [Bacillota bacterium]
MEKEKPLQDVVVLDLTRVLAGPYCSMILANLGAEVLKVERPGIGDDSKSFGPYKNGESAYFVSINRGKKSIAIDLKNEEGKKLIREFAAKADIVLENFRPGTMEKLGLSYEELSKVNPGIIYGAVSGFGHTGPYSRKPAYDVIAQSMSGIMSITGEPEGVPVRIGSSVGDIVGGMFLCIGVVSALYDRVSTGKGQKVDVAMLDGQIAVLENAIARYSLTGEIPGPLGSRHPSITPFEAFKSKDSWVVVACGNQEIWERFCRMANREDMLQDPDFATNDLRTENYKKIKPIIDGLIGQKTTAEWLEMLEANGIPASPINTIDRVVDDPHVKARRMIMNVLQPGMGELHVAGNPVKMSRMEDENVSGYAPGLGEHTDMLLKSYLGYDDDRIKVLRDKRAVY